LETVYKITLSLSSFYNNLEDTVVKTSLPAYVRWMSDVFPENADIFYNQSSGEIVWRADLVESSSGSLKPFKEISFLVSFVPSVAQAGSAPVIIYDVFLEGRDSFTGATINERIAPVSVPSQVLP